MPERTLEYSPGDSLTVWEVDGTFMFKWPNIEENFKSTPTWTARDDDIILCSYPKSGLHWMFEIMFMLVRGSAKRMPDPDVPQVFGMLTEEQYNSIPSPRIMSSHYHFRFLPDTTNRKCRLIFIARNPKDVMVSFYNHHCILKGYEYNGKWEDYFKRFIDGLVDFGSWFEYMNDWEKVMEKHKDIPIHVVYYEDLKTDCLKEIKRLAKFLDLPENLELFKDIDENCKFGKMKEEKDKTEMKHIFVDEKASFYRKGVVGDWKNWFTVAQNEYFDKIFQEKLSNSIFTFKYN